MPNALSCLRICKFLTMFSISLNNSGNIIAYLYMTYTEEQLNQIKKMASIYLKISDMACILSIPAEILREDIKMKNTDVSKAYFSGKASSKLLLRKQEMELAKVGSPLAIENCREALMDMEDDE